MKEVLPGSALRLVAACWVFTLLTLSASALSAQTFPIAPDSLDGGRFVGSARVAKAESVRALRVGGTLGFAHTEDVLKQKDRHERVFSDVSGAFTAVPWFQVALHLTGRYDMHRSPQFANDKGFAGSTALSTRHAFALTPNLALAGQTRFLFPAANAIKRGFTGATTELSALLSYTGIEKLEVTGLLGYRIDRTNHALSNAEALSAADRLAAEVSDFNAVLVGAMVSGQLDRATLLGEWSFQVQHGSGAPAAMESPMRLRAAVQTLVGDRIVPGLEFGVSVSRRPVFTATDLVRVEPRLWAAITLNVLLGKKSAPAVNEEPTPILAAEVRPTTGELLVRVDDGGAPIAGAAVTIASTAETLSAETDASGVARFQVKRDEILDVSVTANGCHPASQTVVVEQSSHTLPISLQRTLPEGEIKGKVRSLRGGPLRSARVEVVETGRVVQTKDDGTFLIEVPPGDYRLRISADGHETQERTAQVERLGVTILVVDLRRTSK